jgi:1,4-alpha-glucan branching enzyme
VYKKKSGALTIAEDLQNDSSVTQYGGCNFRSQWYADFLHTMRTQLKLSDDSWRDMNALAHIIGFVDNGEHTRLVKYVESHDECAGKNGKQRLIEDIWSGNARSYYSMKRASLGVLAAIFSPGIPMIFQGQENLEWATGTTRSTSAGTTWRFLPRAPTITSG